jgi:ribosome biogenesis ATPase
MIDPAMCRPGRLDKLLYVDLPSSEERVEILRTLIRKTPLGPGDREAIIQSVGAIILNPDYDGFSGADLAAFVRESAVVALKRHLGLARQQSALQMDPSPDQVRLLPQPSSMDAGPIQPRHFARPNMFVTLEDFIQALPRIVPSVSGQQRKRYNMLRKRFGNAGLPEKDPRPEADDTRHNDQAVGGR